MPNDIHVLGLISEFYARLACILLVNTATKFILESPINPRENPVLYVYVYSSAPTPRQLTGTRTYVVVVAYIAFGEGLEQMNTHTL